MPLRAFRPVSSLVVLAAALAACSQSTTGPAGQLDAAATTQTVQKVQQSFTNSSVVSFQGAAPAIDSALGTTAGLASAFVSPGTAANAGRLQAFGQRQLALLNRTPPSGTLASTVATSIPTIALGQTFEWNATLGRYAVATTPPSDLSPVPSNGVRFLLYAWDSVSKTPSTPLTRVGYADLTETTNASGRTYRLVVTANSIVYLDYSATYTASQAQQSVVLSITGFVTNGTTRANFTLANSIAAANNGSITLDWNVTVPSESIVLAYLISARNLLTPAGDEQLLVDLSLQGGGGRIQLNGLLTVASGATVNTADDDLFNGFAGPLTVKVNGGTFATITLAGTGTPTIVNAQGQPLTAPETVALKAVFDMLEKGFDFIGDLLHPVERFFV